MVFAEYHKDEPHKYIFVSNREELPAFIEWVKGFLAEMERKGRTSDSAFDFREQKD